jgi:2-(1,2-epoxy-1,2-dihydrophenyl)acetyl-CoA isomerase
VTANKTRTAAAGPGQAGVVTVERAGALAVIRLGVPALTTPAKEELLAAVSALAGDESVRALMLTGTGRVFCAGQDLAEHAAALDADPNTAFETIARHYNPIITALTGAPKPVLAAINGTCAGAGISLALACDLRICGDTAKFATAFTGIGLSFDSGLSATLARSAGAARASELILRGEPFTAEQAQAWGLVGEVVPAAELDAAARALAGRLAAGPTLAYAAAKAALQRGWPAPLADVLAAEQDDQRRLGLTEDHRNAVAAFLAKQRPRFAGR